MTVSLRPYQIDCLSAVYTWLRERTDSPVAVLGTGLGKSVIIARMALDVAQSGGRCLIAIHTRELVRQNADAIVAMGGPGVSLGVYSAGLKRRDTDHAIIVAGIQSIYDKAVDLGSFALIIVDEVHLINDENDQTRYTSFLADMRVINPSLRLVGYTATDFRTSSGMIHGPGKMFAGACFRTDLKEMIAQGYLAPITTKASRVAVDLSEVSTRGGEYVPGEVEDAFDHDEITRAALDEAVALAGTRTHWLVFAAGISHAMHITERLVALGIAAACVTGKTPTDERDRMIQDFKDGKLRALVSVAVLTTGVNIPAVDLILFLRATKAPGLWVQAIGRGMRPFPGKKDVCVLDYGNNAERFGPLDQIRPREKGDDGDGEAPAKVCPECAEVVGISIMVCPACAYEFPKIEKPKHDTRASEAPILSQPSSLEVWPVDDVTWQVWKKKGADEGAPKTVMVTYHSGLRQVREWLCFSHSGYARRKAEDWWHARMGDAPCPSSSELACDAMNMDEGPKRPSSVGVLVGGQYPELRSVNFSKPCTSCRFFEGGHCAKWQDDVPKANLASGCQFHDEKAEAAPVDADSEIPF